MLRAAIVCLLVFISSFSSMRLLAQDGFKVTGTIVDFDTRQPIKNVSIVVRKTTNGTITNDSGYFSLPLRLPEAIITISYVGYQPVTKQIFLLQDSRPIFVELKKRANEQLDEVVVNAYKESSKLKGTEMNIVKINTEQIKRAPLLFGEADIIKALILQPGVTNTGEGSGGYNVRGGNADQNLVLIDGAPLFNTSHLLGFYSSVSPDMVQDVTLYKGAMPAPYGGRLSSLLTMKLKSGNNNRMQYSGGVGPMSARLFVNGPIVKNKLTISAGGRVAYPNPILNQLKDQFGASRAFFFDATIKAELAINSKNKLAFSFYRSFDRFKFDTTNSYDWQNSVIALNYQSQLNNRLSFNLNANYSGFTSGIDNLEKYYESRIESSISQKQVKPVFTYDFRDNHQLKVGFEYLLLDISPGDRRPGSDSSNITSLGIQSERGRELSFFLNDEVDLFPWLSLQAGLRFSKYDYLGPHNVYQYTPGLPLSKETISDTGTYSKNKSIENYGGLEPRLAIKITLDDESVIKLSYNRGQQFLHLISNTTSISPVDFWKLSDQYVKRQVGNQFSLGLFKTLKNSKYELSAEFYYKNAENMVAYKDGALLLMNPYIESALLNQSGRSYGAEFSASKNTGKFTGQINYTYSRAEVRVNTVFKEEIVNGGNYYPSEIDRPHNLSIIGKVKLGKGWSFSSNFIFMSGRPATYPDGNYVYNGTLVTNYSKRNADRLPSYHRLDAGFTWVSKRFPEQKKYSLWNISFYNIYMRKNAYSIFFKREGTRLNAYRLSVVGGLIPSVTWNYYF